MADESVFEFDQNAVLGSRLAELTPEQFVALIQGLCQAVQSCELEFHGGINASNVSLGTDNAVGLGGPLETGEHLRYSADQIEYLAPEVFWKNARSPQADVYSLGLMMYTWLNGGCLPFLYPNATATDRAEALRRRMSGEDFEIPDLSETLTVIIEKATAYSASDRYENCGALLDAFQLFAEDVEANGPAIAVAVEHQRQKQAREERMMADILAAAEAATAPQSPISAGESAKKQYQVDKAIPQPQPVEEKKKFNARPLVAILLIAAVLMIAAVAMQFTKSNPNPDDQLQSDLPTTPTPPPVSISPPATVSPDVTDEPTTSPDVTEPPVVTPSPTPSSQDGHTYNLYIEDLSWNQAADKCINAGGNLVVINDEQEFKAITDLADTYGVELVWVGGFRKDGQIAWVNGETSNYYPWADGEPSYQDADGTAENFLLLWKLNGKWVYNDSRDDPISAYPKAYSGKIAYICEMEN